MDQLEFQQLESDREIYTDRYGHTYGIRRDGSVIAASSQDGTSQSNYMVWKLNELFAGDSGVVGLTPEGRLVGDGTFSGSFLNSLD